MAGPTDEPKHAADTLARWPQGPPAAEEDLPGLRLDFYGVVVSVECPVEDVRHRIASDFDFFLVPDDRASAGLTIVLEQVEPDYDALPSLTAQVYTPRNVCYTDGDVTYIDYFGRALLTYDRSRNHYRLASNEPHLLHEVVYLTILSQVGAKLGRIGLHRVHALAVGAGEEAALFMMDSGGGKTTLGLGFLQGSSNYRLLSEDSPLVTRKGTVLPFPLRLGVLPPVPEQIDPKHVYYMERMEFGPKYLISLKAFKGRLASGEHRPRFLFIGQRRLGRDCEIRPTGRFHGFRALLRNMIVGVGLYQGLEFLLRSSPFELFLESRVLAGRMMAAMRLLFRSRVYVVELGRDRARNLERVIAFLDKQKLGRN